MSSRLLMRRFGSRMILSVTILIAGCTSQPPPKEDIEERALNAIQFDELDPAVRNFIKLAQENKTIGRPISDFEEILEHASSVDQNNGTRLDDYNFDLPMTEETRQANNATISGGGGVIYWPQLVVRVDRKTHDIGFVYLIMRGF